MREHMEVNVEFELRARTLSQRYGAGRVGRVFEARLPENVRRAYAGGLMNGGARRRKVAEPAPTSYAIAARCTFCGCETP
jgi:hypothetical protein